MNNRLSHSSVEVFKECPKKFQLQYKDKLRSETTSSALLFGSAIDKSLESALKIFPNCTERYVKIDFLKHWATGELNGKVIDIRNSELVKYSKADHELDENPWISLCNKGYLIIEAFFRDVLPNIEKVLSSQEEIALTNDNGDVVVGFADAVVQWKGYKQPIIMDIKTAGRKYAVDAVVKSPQLTLYKHSLNDKYKTSTGGYIVFIKTINKNASKICTVCKHDGSETSHKTCNNQIIRTGDIKKSRCDGELTITYNPKVDVQILIDDIDEKYEDELLSSFDTINIQLQEEVFEHNWDNCYGKFGKCGYYDLCHHDSMVGLVKVESRKK